MRTFVVLLFVGCGTNTKVPTTHDPIARNESCASCHAEIAREWDKSMHHASFDDPIFRASYEREPARFCVDCHAPEDKSGEGRSNRLASLGTACTSCHATFHEKQKSVATCNGCHEFSFPGRESSARLEDKMQRTLAEHAQSSMHDVECTSCHMPVVNGHKSHVFGGGNDPAWLRSALDVKTSREGDNVTITIAPGNVAHAVPTGDLFRRLFVGIEKSDGTRDGKPMGRHFAIEKGERVEIADTRPGSNGTNASSVTFQANGRVRWFVDYQRVLGQTPDDTEIAQDLRVMEGVIE